MGLEFVHKRCLSPALESEIDAFLDSQDSSHPFQLPGWWPVDQGHCAILRDESRIRWFAMCGVSYPSSRVLRGIRALTISHGPVCDDAQWMAEGLNALAEYCRRHSLAYLDVAAECVGPAAEGLRCIVSRDSWQTLGSIQASLRLDLRTDTDQLFGGFRKSTRYEIRRAEREGVLLQLASTEGEIEEFLATLYRMAAHKRFSPGPPSHLRGVLKGLLHNRGRGTLLLGYREGVLLGGTAVVRVGARCWYVWGARNEEAVWNVGHLLQWRAIEWARTQGCTEYDFGGYREGSDSGPALFKKGFGGRVVQFPPASRYIVDARLCRIANAISAARRLPARLAAI